MRIEFTPKGWQDYSYWVEADQQITVKIHTLIKAIVRDPFRGEGRPEPLKNELKGYWSRRITREHRLVYRVLGKGDEKRCSIIQCRFHY